MVYQRVASSASIDAYDFTIGFVKVMAVGYLSPVLPAAGDTTQIVNSCVLDVASSGDNLSVG